MTKTTPTIPTIADLAAWQTHRTRQRRRLSHTTMAPACATLGAPQLGPKALSNIEQRRRAIDLDEVPVLAAVLGIPPLLLLFPPDVPTVLTLGRQTSTRDTARWWAGEGPRPFTQVGTNWENDAAPVILSRQHERHVSEWRQAPRLAEIAAGDDGDVAGIARRLQAHAITRLRMVRDEMRRRALTPPGLPEQIKELA